MGTTFDLSGTKLEPEKKEAVETFCSALLEASEQPIKSINLYGSAAREDYRPGASDINLLIVMDPINVSTLKNTLDPVFKARRHRIAPFFITPDNLRNSLDVFPIKFLSIKESYRLLWGEDILAGLEIHRDHLRWRCEQETRNLRMRLVRHYIMGGGQNLSQMMGRNVIGFVENLRVAVSLIRDGLPSREDVVDAAADAFGFEAEVLQKVLALHYRENFLPNEECELLYDQYMELVDKVAQAVDEID